MARIGLISDTHSFLDPVVLEYFVTCDEIWHAGDFGSVEVAEQLARCRPLRGVYGNIDDEHIRNGFPLDERFQYQGMDVWITHIAGRPGRYDRRVRAMLKQQPPGMLICGHSHILQIQRDATYDGMVFANPGAAGHSGFHTERTAMLLEITAGQLQRAQAIQLGPRGRRPQT